MHEEPMKQWIMKEIKEVVTQELENARRGHMIQLNFICPELASLVTMYLDFWYKNPEHRLEQSWFTMWNLLNKQIQDHRRLANELEI